MIKKIKDKIKEKIQHGKQDLLVKVNAFFLAAFPIVEYLKSSLPDLQPYMSQPVYQTVGVIVVSLNIYLGLRRAARSLDDDKTNKN